jgi:tRNA pseudouridine55 synthase
MTGFIIIDKSEGVSSAREVGIVKKLTGTPCGHMGTLDPMASGVLPVAIGNAARLFDYFLDKQKTYVATFKFGIECDTLDTTGKVLSCGGYVPTEEQIKKVIPTLCGEVMQVPPSYSAKNINGKRGYELARAGVEFTLPPKKVNIYSIDFLGKKSVDEYDFEIVCGGGTYIRSIARDMAQALNTCAAMSALRRTKSGIFDIINSVRSEQLTAENINDYMISTDSVLPFESFYPNESQAKKLFNGLAINCNLPDGMYKIYNEKSVFYGLATSSSGLLKVRSKLC